MKAEHRIKGEHRAAEHRKELRTNVLADRMGRFMQNVRQRPRGRTILVWIVVILAILGLIIWYLWAQTAHARNSEWWRNLYHGFSADEIKKEFPDSKQQVIAEFARDWSYLWNPSFPVSVPIQKVDPKTKKQKEVSLYGGIANLKTVPLPMQLKQQTAEEVREGLESYFIILENQHKALLDKVENDPILAPEALYNLAVIQETLATFDIEKLTNAKGTFQKLRDDFPDSARGVLAEQRLKDAYTGENFERLREFYRDLNEQHHLQKLGAN